ncbi:MAG: hypothetical protein FJY54_11120 [Betaproteobacteria bacterium]|nr:hypothetical protein [Betaproteobacteria bacterium]
MPDTVRKVDYFSIQVPDKPGQAFSVLSALVSAGIDLLACSGSRCGDQAQIDVVPQHSSLFRAAVKKAGLAFTPRKSGFLVQGKDRPGALAQNLEKLAATKINVTAIDAVTAGEGRWGAIIWVTPEDVANAVKVLRAKTK